MKRQELKVQVAEADVDDVIEIAAKMMAEEEGQLSLTELQEVGEELDIPAEYVERAQKELVEQRKREKAELEAKVAFKRNVFLAGGGAAVVLALVLGVGTMTTGSTLAAIHADVEAARAQVENVKARKASVEELYKGQPDSPDKMAELMGAENRVRVETKRYSEAAAAYNRKADGLFAGMARAVKGLPAEVPTTP